MPEEAQAQRPLVLVGRAANMSARTSGSPTLTPSRHHDRVWHEAHDPIVMVEEPWAKEISTRGDVHRAQRSSGGVVAMPGLSGQTEPTLSDEAVKIGARAPSAFSRGRPAG